MAAITILLGRGSNLLHSQIRCIWNIFCAIGQLIMCNQFPITAHYLLSYLFLRTFKMAAMAILGTIGKNLLPF